MIPIQTCTFAGLLLSALAPPALAGPGDLHEVAADLVNLRADWMNAMGGPIDVGLFATNVTDQEVLLGGAGGRE